MDQSAIEKLKERYNYIHPLIFYRSLEKSKTLGELFDILDSFPNEYPIVWNEADKKWQKLKNKFLFDLER